MKRLSIILAVIFCVLPGFALAKPDYSVYAPAYLYKTGLSWSESVQNDVLVSDEAADGRANDPNVQFPGVMAEYFENLQSDPDPEELVRSSHYWVSNENAHYVWYPYVRDLGGVISGVGTDQIYLIAGWMQASLIIPMDFDRKITMLHLAYGAAFLDSENIQQFLEFWNNNAEERMRHSMERYFPDLAGQVLEIWKTAQPIVRSRLGKLIRKYGVKHKNDKASGVPTFVTDETQYQHIRMLWKNHRVYPVCGDLTGTVGMKSIANALNKAGMKMSVVYTSNAGQYFSYTPAFKQNFIDMPFSEKSLILRTRQLSSLGVAEPDDYHYNIQNAQNFQRWLKAGHISDMPKMLRKRSKTSTIGLSMILEEPESGA